MMAAPAIQIQIYIRVGILCKNPFAFLGFGDTWATSKSWPAFLQGLVVSMDCFKGLRLEDADWPHFPLRMIVSIRRRVQRYQDSKNGPLMAIICPTIIGGLERFGGCRGSSPLLVYWKTVLMNDVSGQHKDVCDVFLIHLLSKLRRISSIYCQDAFEIVSFIRRVTRIYSSLYKPSDSRTTKIGRESCRYCDLNLYSEYGQLHVIFPAKISL